MDLLDYLNQPEGQRFADLPEEDENFDAEAEDQLLEELEIIATIYDPNEDDVE